MSEKKMVAYQENKAVPLRGNLATAIRAVYCPANLSDSEFLIFQDYCNRNGLSPIEGDVFVMKQGSRLIIDVERNGYLKKAKQDPLYINGGRLISDVLYENEDIDIDYLAGTIKYKKRIFNKTKRGDIYLAWAILERQGCKPIVAIEYFDERANAQKNRNGEMKDNWKNYPVAMIRAGAEKAALKKIYAASLVPISEVQKEFVDRVKMQVYADKHNLKLEMASVETVEAEDAKILPPAPTIEEAVEEVEEAERTVSSLDNIPDDQKICVNCGVIISDMMHEITTKQFGASLCEQCANVENKKGYDSNE